MLLLLCFVIGLIFLYLYFYLSILFEKFYNSPEEMKKVWFKNYGTYAIKLLKFCGLYNKIQIINEEDVEEGFNLIVMNHSSIFDNFIITKILNKYSWNDIRTVSRYSKRNIQNRAMKIHENMLLDKSFESLEKSSDTIDKWKKYDLLNIILFPEGTTYDNVKSKNVNKKILEKINLKEDNFSNLVCPKDGAFNFLIKKLENKIDNIYDITAIYLLNNKRVYGNEINILFNLFKKDFKVIVKVDKYKIKNPKSIIYFFRGMESPKLELFNLKFVYKNIPNSINFVEKFQNIIFNEINLNNLNIPKCNFVNFLRNNTDISNSITHPSNWCCLHFINQIICYIHYKEKNNNFKVMGSSLGLIASLIIAISNDENLIENSELGIKYLFWFGYYSFKVVENFDNKSCMLNINNIEDEIFVKLLRESNLKSIKCSVINKKSNKIISGFPDEIEKIQRILESKYKSCKYNLIPINIAPHNSYISSKYFDLFENKINEIFINKNLSSNKDIINLSNGNLMDINLHNINRQICDETVNFYPNLRLAINKYNINEFYDFGPGSVNFFSEVIDENLINIMNNIKLYNFFHNKFSNCYKVKNLSKIFEEDMSINEIMHYYCLVPILFSCKKVITLIKNNEVNESEIIMYNFENDILKSCIKVLFSMNIITYSNQFIKLNHKIKEEELNIESEINNILLIKDLNEIVNYINEIFLHKTYSKFKSKMLGCYLLVNLIEALYLSKKDLNDIKFKLQTFFLKLNLLDNDFKINKFGNYINNNFKNFLTTVSYSKMYYCLENLIFNSEKINKAKDQHVNRELNVIGSDIYNDHFFKKIKKMIFEIFNSTDIENQPNYILESGCGNGSLSIQLYNIIKKTTRGSNINKYPLKIILTDFSHIALKLSSENLSKNKVPHLSFFGDINKPFDLEKDLKKNNIKFSECIYIRTFIDHEIDFHISKNIFNYNEAREIISFDKNYKLIDKKLLYSRLVEHFQKWRYVTHKYGILLSEVFSLSKEINKKYYYDSGIHFDFYHEISNQLLVSPRLFLLSAAHSGLLISNKYNNIFPENYTRIITCYLEPIDFCIRNIYESDIEEIIKIEDKIWANEKIRDNKEFILKLLRIYPSGQFLAIKNNKIIAYLFSQKIDDFNILKKSNRNNLLNLYDEYGKTIQLLKLCSLENNIGLKLINFVKILGKVDKLENMVGLTRLSNYDNNINYNSYVYSLEDENIKFHKSNGADIISIVNNYWPEDYENKGNGILIKYDLNKKNKSSKSQIFSTKNIKEKISLIVRDLAKIDRIGDNDKLNLILDSLQITELSIILKEHNINIKNYEILEYNTINKIIFFVNSI